MFSDQKSTPHTPLSHLQMELDHLKSCIHCGICLPVCPTYEATGSEAESPRGRLYMMKKMLDGELSSEAVSPHLSKCLACSACETACPSGVSYGRILLGAREDIAERDQTIYRRFRRLIFKHVLPKHGLLRFLRKLLFFYQHHPNIPLLGYNSLSRRFPHSSVQRDSSQTDLSQKGLSNFSHLGRLSARLLGMLPQLPNGYRPLDTGMHFGKETGERVVLLTGCVMDIFYNATHWETIEVLVANGYQVIIPAQKCCGALAHHAGEGDVVRSLARQNIESILAVDPQWIVTNSAGCGSTLKEYGHLLAHESMYTEKAQQFSAKVVDIMELLAKKPLASFKNYGLYDKVAYHAACHLHHVQKIRTEPVMLLDQIPGIRLIPLENETTCCGSAGIYNVEQPELSETILEAKMAAIADACVNGGITTVVTGNPGCLLQIEKGVREHGLPLRVRHPISILAEAYR